MDVAPGLGVGAEAVLDASGRVTALREGRGGTPSRRMAPSSQEPSRAPTGCAPTRNRAIPSALSDSVSGDGATLEGGTGIVNGGPGS
jgi:hypothetical protein